MKMVKYLYYWHKHIQFIRAALIMLGGKLVTFNVSNIWCFRVFCSTRAQLFLYTTLLLRRRWLLFIGKVHQNNKNSNYTTKTNNHIKYGNSPQMTDTVYTSWYWNDAYSRGSLYHSQLNYYIVLYIGAIARTHTHPIFFSLLFIANGLSRRQNKYKVEKNEQLL